MLLLVVMEEEEDMDTHTDTDTAVLQHILLKSHRRMVVVVAVGGGIAGHTTNTLLLPFPLPLLLLVVVTWTGMMGHTTPRRQWTRSQRASLHVRGRNHHLHQMQIKWQRTCRKRVPSVRAASLLHLRSTLIQNSRRRMGMSTLTRAGVVRVPTMAAAAAVAAIILLHRGEATHHHTKEVMGAAMAELTWGGQCQHLPPELMLLMEHTTSITADMVTTAMAYMVAAAMAVVVTAMASTRTDSRASLSSTLTTRANTNKHRVCSMMMGEVAKVRCRPGQGPSHGMIYQSSPQCVRTYTLVHGCPDTK